MGPLSIIPVNQRRMIAVGDPALGLDQPVPEEADIVGSVVKGVFGLTVLGATYNALTKKSTTQKMRPGRSTDLPRQILRVGLEQLDDTLRFPPGHPVVGGVYGLNPVRSDVYIPLADFHRIALREKACELFSLLAGLRASNASVVIERGTLCSGKVALSALLPVDVPIQVSAAGGGASSAGTRVAYDLRFSGSGAPHIPPNLRWLEHEPEWRSIASGRLEHGMMEFNIALRYTDTLGVGAEIALKLEDLGFSLGGRYEAAEEESWEVSGTFAKKPFLGW